MNSLIIVANPRKDSFSFAIADTYKKKYESENRQIEILDLYSDKHQQPFFTFDNANKLESTPEIKYYQEKISKADELVFVFPYWWGSMPAILKNFFDWNFAKDFAFTYVNSRPKGLLTGKTVKVYCTTGAPSIYYQITGANKRLRNMMKKQIFQFCDMKVSSFKIFGGVDTSAKNVDKILEKI